MNRLPLVLLLVGTCALAAGPAPTVTLKGQHVSLPPAVSVDHKTVPVNVIITAQRDALLTTLAFRGWAARPITEALRVDGKVPDFELETSGAAIDERLTLRLWQRPDVPEQDPLWLAIATIDRGVRPLESTPPSLEPSQTALQRVLADLSYGVSQTRQVIRTNGTPSRVAWVELHFAPEDAEHVLPPAEDIAAPPEPSKLVLRPLPPVAPASEVLITRVDGAGKRVALTFDACSTLDRSQYDKKVIEVLRKEKVPATLFVSGRWAETHVKELMDLAGDPLFEIANHSYIHPHMTEVPASRRKEELLWTQEILYSLTGRVPRFFRPPYGEWNPDLVQEAAKLGLRTVEYDLPSGDPDKHVTVEKLTDWVVRKAHPGSVVVMHMNRHGWHTAESLPAIIKALRAKGLVFSRIGDMVDAGAKVPATSSKTE